MKSGNKLKLVNMQAGFEIELSSEVIPSQLKTQ